MCWCVVNERGDSTDPLLLTRKPTDPFTKIQLTLSQKRRAPSLGERRDARHAVAPARRPAPSSWFPTMPDRAALLSARSPHLGQPRSYSPSYRGVDDRRSRCRRHPADRVLDEGPAVRALHRPHSPLPCTDARVPRPFAQQTRVRLHARQVCSVLRELQVP